MAVYESYKVSIIPWIRQIPAHWETRRAKYMFKKEKREVRSEDRVITCFRDGQVTLRENRRTTGFTESITEVGYQGIREGDLVIHQMDAFAGSIGVSDSDGKGTSVYHCCTPTGPYIPQYYAYALREMARAGYIQSLYRGIRERSSDFNFFTFGRQFLPVPPIEEQERIVEYLDKEITLIESCKCQRERELQTLNELKQAEIASVVTRGLNPNVPMKDSGFPWIGMIPEHWNVKSLRAYLHLVSEKNHPNATLLSVTREQGVIVRDVDSKEENHNFIPEDLSGYKFVRKGQFVINKMKAWQGSYGVSLFDGIVSPAYYVCDLDFPNKEYFSLAIRSKTYVDFFARWSKGIRVGQWDLEPIALKSVPFLEPPVKEMQEIVDYVKSKTQKIDTMIEALTAEIDRLTEYKQRLISDVVTGQINVQDE